ncbi:hypothetical protein [Salegentibacter salarius]|uniref:HEPN domain-containing protein n=1 Tax=Salegentibacter salarius TaxID=435906 RepID=A0A2N0TR96_9FLAO|nr:hypothetical protein [Salegentibacter salarius]OEY71911.1 hypothetical protein BHS39_14940 [Salegentibacter salarius]PKD17259.1 hypothetical protein APR40_14910 [Salegentibacter salarius]SLK06130.1 hypothetical protein SAMN05660445_03076 [Salegentibacter salarius]
MNKKKRFVYFSSPEHWFQAASELNDVVEELYLIRDKAHYTQFFGDTNQRIKRPAYSRGTYLLMAYALENLLKGIAVLNNPDLVNTGKIDKSIKTHDLNELSGLNDFRPNNKQKEFQSILSAQCISNARYPVGLNEQIEMTDPSVTDEDFTIYKKLFKKYQSYLASNFNLKGWDSGLNDPSLKTKPGEWHYFENN